MADRRRSRALWRRWELVESRTSRITVIVGEEVKTSQGEVMGIFLTERMERT